MTFRNFITNLLYNVMDRPFHSNASFFQSLFYNLKVSSSRVPQRPLATETAREGGETEYRGFFCTAVSMTMTSVDTPRQPTYPSLDF